MKFIGWHLAVFLASCQGLFGIVRIEESTNPPPCRPLKYTLHDLGETTVDPALMSPYALPHSYAPRINNASQIFGNRLDEGFLKDFNYGEMVPQVGNLLKGHIYGLNDNGDIVVAIQRNRTDLDWFVWSQKKLRKEKRYSVEPLEGMTGSAVDLRSINGQQWAVGYFNPGSVLRAAVWNPRWGLKSLGFYLGWDLQGIAWGINNRGTIVGYTSELEEHPPFVWNECGGFETLKSYRIPFETQSCHDIRGPVHFADIVVTGDDYVYGTLWIDDEEIGGFGSGFYYAYRWEPYNHDFRYLDLGGMRINAVNQAHTLVGSINGAAAFREKGRRPVLLKNYVTGNDWTLIEATGINDRGDIVGYGKYNDGTHLFLMKRE